MKPWGTIIVTAFGFLMGLILAGVGVTSAKTYFLSNKAVEKKAETYWQDTGLNSKELYQLVSNSNCQSSEKYFLACVNSVIQILPKFHLKLSAQTGQISTSAQASVDDGRSEKENLQPFIKMYEKQNNLLVNFELIWHDLLEKEQSDSSKSYLVGIGINSFLSVYKDPHTYILPSMYFEEVGSKFERSNLFVGLAFEKKQGCILVRKVFKGSDAEAAGLKAKDEVLEINGIKSEQLNLFDISSILKESEAKQFNFKIRRNKITENIEVKRSYKKLNHVLVEKESGLRDYSVVTLTKFSRGVCAEVSKKIKAMTDESIAGMILDLRDNPGGELNEAACLAGLFLGINKKIYSVKYFDPLKSDEVVLTTGSLLYTGPLVVLVNSSSASASELLAGALQDYNRAALVGERTFGKGTFQEGEVWSKNSQITLFRTQGFYLLPSGVSPQLKGITPDLIQEEDRVTQREETTYFNPIMASSEFKTELGTQSKRTQFASEFKKCLPSLSFSKEDKILQLGLETLSCHRISSFMAGQYSIDEFN